MNITSGELKNYMKAIEDSIFVFTDILSKHFDKIPLGAIKDLEDYYKSKQHEAEAIGEKI